MKFIRKNSRAVVVGVICTFVVACGGAVAKDPSESLYNAIVKSGQQRAAGAYIPHNGVEFRNYNDAQKLYDSPNTIIYCTTTWGNPSAPLVTIPVAGKLTSSSTSLFSSEGQKDFGDAGVINVPRRSVDGMYHANPPQYRYGFTPGGQYVDFFEMPTLCTTALTKLQRQKTTVATALDQEAVNATKQAEAALARGDKAGAQKALAALDSSK